MLLCAGRDPGGEGGGGSGRAANMQHQSGETVEFATSNGDEPFQIENVTAASLMTKHATTCCLYTSAAVMAKSD